MQRTEFEPDYRQLNPWWDSSDVSEADQYQSERRSDYQYKLRSVRNNRFVTFAGAAGSGKTTILHQIADNLITEDDVHSQNVMYLPLGDPRFQIGSDVIIDAVDEFATYYWQQDANPKTGYVLIDDAHATDSWSEQVHACLDQYDDLTIAVTLPTVDRANIDQIEKLDIEIGRDVLLPPKYYDVISETHGVEIEKETVRNVRDALESAADTGDVTALKSAIESVLNSIESTSTLQRGVREYLQGSGRDVSIEDVRNNLELTVYRDVPRYQQFDDRSDLHALCAIAAMYPGQTLGLKNLSEILDCDRRTLQRYIDILEDFFIVTPSYQYKYERRRSVRLYIRDPVLMGSLLELDYDELLPTRIERKLMTAVIFDHLKRLGFRYHRSNAPVDFWESGDSDVDFVIETGEGTPIPIVTPDANQDRASGERLRAFREDHDCTLGVEVARDIEPEIGENITTLPLSLFLFVI